MFRLAASNSNTALWLARLARVPRWVWVVLGLAILIPLTMLVLAAVAVGLIVAAGVIASALVRNWLLGFRQRPTDDGRRNVRVVVRTNYDTP